MRNYIKKEGLLWERFIVLSRGMITYLKYNAFVEDNEYVFDKNINDVYFKRNVYKARTIILECNLSRIVRVDLLLNFIKNNNLKNVNKIAVRSCCYDEVHFCSPTFIPHPLEQNITYKPYKYREYHICSLMKIFRPTHYPQSSYLCLRKLSDILYDMKECILYRHNLCEKDCCKPHYLPGDEWVSWEEENILFNNQLEYKNLRDRSDNVCNICQCVTCERKYRENIEYLF